MPNSKEPLIVDLSSIQETKPMDGVNSCLHREAMRRLMECVATVLGRINDFKNSLHDSGDSSKIWDPYIYRRHHGVITVHGRRGAGKTTFLLTALKALTQNQSRRDAFFTDLAQGDNTFSSRIEELKQAKIHSLGILDPTLLARRERLLTTVLDRICRAVEKEYGTIFRYHQDEQIVRQKFERWNDDFRSLADGLKAIGELGEGGGDDFTDDAQSFFDQRLVQARHGSELESKIHQFMSDSLELLGCKAFILGLDDIDTMPEVGWQVMEVLRKYFTSPQLITILCGDLELYSTLVRKNQLDSFGYTLKDRADDIQKGGKDNLHSLIDGIVEQYVLKILSSNSRVNLGNFSKYYSEQDANRFRFEKSERPKASKEQPTLGQLLKHFYERVMFYSLPSEQNSSKGISPEYRMTTNVLLNLPVRTVLQFLSGLYSLNEAITDYNSGLASQQTITSREDKVRTRLINIFLMQLEKCGYQSPQDELEDLREVTGIIKLGKNLWRRGIIKEAAAMLPNLSNFNLNPALIAVNATLTKCLQQHPALFFHYILRLAPLCTNNPSQSIDQSKSKEEFPSFMITQNLTAGSDWLVYYLLDLGLPGQGLKPYMQHGIFETKVRVTNNKTKVRNMIAARFGLYEVAKSSPSSISSPSNFLAAIKGAYKDFDPELTVDQNNQIVDSEQASKELYNALEQLGGAFRHSAGYLSKTFTCRRIREQSTLFARYANTLDTLQDGMDSWHYRIAGLQFIEFGGISGQGVTYFSFYSLLALIGRLLECRSNRAIIRTLKMAGQVRLYSLYAGQQRAVQMSEGPEDEVSDDVNTLSIYDKTDEQFTTFVSIIEKWKNRWSQCNCQAPATLLVRSMQRFQSNMDHIDQSLAGSRGDRFAGFYLHRSLAAFFNAILIEENILRNEGSDLYLRYMKKSDSLLLANMARLELLQVGPNDQQYQDMARDNLYPSRGHDNFRIDQEWVGYQKEMQNQGKLNEKSKLTEKTSDHWNKYPFFSMIFSCPIWGLFLEPTYSNSNVTNVSIGTGYYPIVNNHPPFEYNMTNSLFAQHLLCVATHQSEKPADHDETIKEIKRLLGAIRVTYRMSDDSDSISFINLYYLFNSLIDSQSASSS